MSPQVSVVLPSYNHARFLPRRLDSILYQTFQDFELIALDDHSSDDTRQVLKDYSRRRPMRLVLNEQNSGSPFKQWRRGAELASAKYVWIAESDDFADIRLLETLVGRMNSRPNIGLAYCQSYMVDERDNVIGKYDFIPQQHYGARWENDYFNDGTDEVARYLFSLNTIPNASAVLVKTHLLLSAMEQSADMRLMGDWWTWARVLMQSDVAFVAEPLNFFRMHASSVRTSTKRAIACREAFHVQAHISARIKVARTLRRRAVQEGFAGVWAYLDSGPVGADSQWMQDVFANAKALHWSARARLWYLKMKRHLKRIPFLTQTVRRLRAARTD